MPLPELLRALWLWRWRILGTWFVLLAAGVTLVLTWPRQYVAEAVVTPAETTGLAVSTLIQANAVLQAGGLLDNRSGGNFAVYLALLRSPEAAAMLMRDTALPAWLTQQRGGGPMGLLRQWLDLRIESDADDLQNWLERNFAVTQSLQTVTVTLGLPHPDRAMALDALARLHAFAEDKVRADLAGLTRNRIAQLEERLGRERDVFTRTPLYDLLAQHQRAGLALLTDEAVAARLVSAPSVPLAPSLPNRPLLIALLLVTVPLAVLLGAACLVLLRQALPAATPESPSGAGPGGRMVLPPLPPVALPPELRGDPVGDPGQPGREPGGHGRRDARDANGGNPRNDPSPAPSASPPGASAGPWAPSRPAPPLDTKTTPLGQRRGHPDFAPLPRPPSPMAED
ncbi:hypothetical protein RGI145_02855 [Roseomonas gilardii]|uniref:Polysaccharide chain length determinant N-terminal domain-containing protein n=1 Tax=Roseomonas gilardii TaxID=257708 RepID=A0A1L7ABP8_9PROT|nr:hypothetical protein [Roseomonas gilardii]APT56206.1 hypothetical protein RGI145_02855 [Roseomonas gilardii]